jgi:hypothetical protein
VIMEMQKVDPRAVGGVRILIKESDRDVSSLEKSSTDITNTRKFSPLENVIILLQHFFNTSLTKPNYSAPNTTLCLLTSILALPGALIAPPTLPD